MAAARGCLPLLATLAVLLSCSLKVQAFHCRRVRGFPTPPCRYYCSYFTGDGFRLAMALERDGTPCGRNRPGICRSGLCFPLINQQHVQSQQLPPFSQRPLRIRKRDTSSVTNAGGGEVTTAFTKTLNPTKTVGSNSKGIKGAVKGITNSNKKKKVRTRKGFDADIDIFSTPNVAKTTSLFSNIAEKQKGSQGLQDADLNIKGNGRGSSISSLDLTTKTTTPLQGTGTSIEQGGLTGGFTGSINTGLTGLGGITLAQTPGGTGTPSAIQGGGTSTILGGGIGSGGKIPSSETGSPNLAGTPSLSPEKTPGTTNLASTTRPEHGPSPSVVGRTGQGSPGGVTGSGVEVEVPGYTTGLGRNWKWVLGRKVGFLPPNVQALDPEILYYKLGYQQPTLPRLPEPIQSLLNRLPVRPVGSDLIGYPGLRSILSNILELRRRLGGQPGLRSLLLRSRLSYPNTRASLLRSLLTGDSSSRLRMSPLDRLLLSSSSPLGSALLSPQGGSPYETPFSSSPYGGYFGGFFSSPFGSPYGGPSGSPWSAFPGSPLSGSPWPVYPGGPAAPFGGFPFYPLFPFSSYPFTRSPFYSGYPRFDGTSTRTVSSRSGVRYTLSPDGKLAPTFEPSTPLSVTLTEGQPSYSKSTTVHSVTSTRPAGIRYVPLADGTLAPVSDTTGTLPLHSITYPGTNRAAEVIPDLIRSVTSKTKSLQGHSREYTLTPDGHLIPTSDSEGFGPLSTLLSDSNSPLYRLLHGPYGADPRLKRYLKSMVRRGLRNNPYRLLRLLGVRPGSSAYDSILVKSLLGGEPGGALGWSGRGTEPLGPGEDEITGLTSLLGDGTVDPNSVTARYIAALARIDPSLSEPLGASRGSPLGSTSKVVELLRRLRQPYDTNGNDPLAQLLYGSDQPLNRGGLRSTSDISRTSNTIDTVLGLSRSRPEPQGTENLRKEITKALMTAAESQKAPRGSISTVTGPSQTTQQTGSHVVSSTYHATNVQSTSPVTSSPVIPLVGTTGQQFQPVLSQGVLGVKSASSVTSGTTLPAYGTPGISQLFPSSSSGVYINGRVVPTTGGVMGSTLSHPGTTSLVNGGYMSYSGMPTNGLLAATSTHPYVLAASPLGGHPHYVVEGHEAPGTRWQLKVWRHHPGVSALIPGMIGAGTSPLSGILSQATQGVTHVLPLSSQPSHFGFTSYHASSPGLGLLGTSPLSGMPTVGASVSHYIVHAPDGSVVVSRQPGTLGSAAFVTPLSVTQAQGTVVPGLTNVAGSAVNVPGTTLLTTPLQTSLGGGSPTGSVTATSSYQQYSALQNGGAGLSSGLGGGASSLSDSVGSSGSSGNYGSSFSSGSSGSGGLSSDSLRSQSTLK